MNSSSSRCMLKLSKFIHPFSKNLPIIHPYTNQAQAGNKTNQPQPISPSPSFNLKTYMHEKINSFNKVLEQAVPIKEPKILHEAMRYSLFNANKISAMFCIAACQLVGGEESLVIPTATSVQMIDASCLIHDDLPCIDNDDQRSGKPSSHKVYGEAVALLAGDALCSLAFQHMASATRGVSKQRILWAMAELAKCVGPRGYSGGQVLDVCSTRISDFTLEDLESIHMYKAGATGDGFLSAGAIIGGGSDEDVEKVKMFGRCVGILYQVVDEMVDFEKDWMMSDRLTYPKLIGMERCKEFAKKLDAEAEDFVAGFDPQKAAPLVSLKNIYRKYYYCD